MTGRLNYQQLYRSLSPNGQKAMRELMKVLSRCDDSPILHDKTVCQSKLESAVVKVEMCTQEIRERYSE